MPTDGEAAELGPAVSLRGARKDFGSTAALDAIDLDLPRGSVTALLGPNGAGKSTLLHLLAGEIAPSRGAVNVLGIDEPAQADRRERKILRREVSFVPQQVALDPEMTGRETLGLLAALHGIPRRGLAEGIRELAEAFGIAKPLDRPVSTWSGGQKRRLHLAAGMIHEPALLLLDEPTAGLDDEGVATLRKEIDRRAAKGAAVVIATHDRAAAEGADRIVRLEAGRMAEAFTGGASRGTPDARTPSPAPSRLGAARAVAGRTLRSALRRPVLLTFSLGQPLIWMLFFGFLFHRFGRVEIDPTGRVSYLDYLAPGVSAMTLLFGASQSGIGWIRDLQTGFLARLLAAPAGPVPLLAGKIGADVGRLLVQAVVVLVLGLLLGARLLWAPTACAVALLDLALFAVAFAALSSILAFLTRSQEGMATFVHLVNMPLFFTSTALVPHRAMPAWLATIARWNPLSAAVDAWRGALISAERPSMAGTLLLGALAASGFALALSLVRRMRGIEFRLLPTRRGA